MDFGSDRFLPDVDVTAERVHERETGVGGATDTPPPLMDEPVMEATQRHKILEIGGSAVYPVTNMVNMDPPGASTPGEPAPPVTEPHLTGQP